MENAKRERLACDSKESAAVDRINLLPPEVLGLILSFLSLKEATANALVCLSWRNLWTLTRSLDFDGSDSVIGKMEKTEFGERKAVLDEERQNFVRWVDGIIASHRNSNLEGFRVVSDLGSANAKSIDKWLNYALTNKVRSLDLSLFDSTGNRTNANHHSCYGFPHRRIGDFKHLKQLTLHSVNVTGKAVEHLVRRCPLLEHVSVTFSQVLSSLEIIGPSPSFKSLELNLCHNLKSVVVRDLDIVTIKYNGMNKTRFVLIDVPLLTQLWIGGLVTQCMDDVADGLMFGCVFPQLHTLNLHFYCGLKYAKKETKFSFKMPNLKQLVVSFPTPYDDKDSLLPLLKLISAAPYLERFVLELPLNHDDYFFDATAHATETTETPKMSHFHLKEVELVGYRGLMTQLELIMHLVDYAVALQNIIIDPCTFRLSHQPLWRCILLHEFDDEIFARARAEKDLKHVVLKKIGLKIL